MAVMKIVEIEGRGYAGSIKTDGMRRVVTRPSRCVGGGGSGGRWWQALIDAGETLFSAAGTLRCTLIAAALAPYAGTAVLAPGLVREIWSIPVGCGHDLSLGSGSAAPSLSGVEHLSTYNTQGEYCSTFAMDMYQAKDEGDSTEK